MGEQNNLNGLYFSVLKKKLRFMRISYLAHVRIPIKSHVAYHKKWTSTQNLFIN